MQVYPWKKYDDPSKIHDQTPILMNICDHINSNSIYGRLYFGKEFNMSQDSWTKNFKDSPLYKYIMKKAIEGKSPIVANGGGATCRYLVCKDFFKKERKFTRDRKQDKDITYRSVSLVNDRKNQQKGGRKSPRKIKQADTSSGSCRFSAMVKCDDIGPYINLEYRAGCPFHSNHPKPISSEIIPLPLKLLSKDAKKNAVDVVQSAASNAAGRNFLLKNQKGFFDCARMAYLKKKASGEVNTGMCSIGQHLLSHLNLLQS